MPKKFPIQFPPEAFDATPRVSVTLTDESAWLSRYDERGQRTACYPVATADLAAAFSTFGSSTGLLPADTLFWQHTGQGDRLGLWLPPARRTLRFDGHIRPLTLPMPGLVFVGRGRSYWLYAALRRPEQGDRLFCAPLPNVHGDGKICAGSVKFPACTAANIHTAADLFWESEFNYDLLVGNVAHTDNPVKVLRSLSKAKAFPSERLVPSITVNQLLGGEHATQR